MADTYLGNVRAMSFAYAPRGWAECSGQLMPINQNRALYALLGTQFGGDGQTSFALPAQNGTVLTWCISLQGQFPTQ